MQIRSFTEKNQRHYQRRRPRFTVLAVLCALLSITNGAPLRVSGEKMNSTQKSRTLVCVVSGEGEAEMSLDAVVFVEGDKLVKPYDEDKDTEWIPFANEYFKTERKYRLTFGGGDAGTLIIKKWDTGCNNLHAKAEVTTSVKLTGRVRGLATNSESLGHKSAARRAPTSAERATVMQLVKGVYRGKRTPQSLLPRITTTNLTATDLDGDGKYELIGSFFIATTNKFRRDLFLIAEPQGAGYKAALVDYQAYQLPPEEFDSAIDFVDQLDLDGDGVAEVFAIQGGFDAYGYSIYRKQKGRWRNVYSVTGDAC